MNCNLPFPTSSFLKPQEFFYQIRLMVRKIQNDNAIRNTALFLGLLVLCYGIGYWLIFRLERASPLMLSVAVAAIITCLLIRRPIASLGWNWGTWRDNWISYLLPLAVWSTAYLFIWAFGFGELYDIGFVESLKESYNLSHWGSLSIVALHVLISTTYTIAISVPSIAGEEIGWRGFLVPELAKFMSFTNVALISGLIWAVFHWPLMFRGIYGVPDTPLVFQLLCFSLFIVATSFVLTYFRFKTGSIWPAVLFHGAGNVYSQQVFGPLTLSNDNSVWYVGEFGAIPAIVSVAVAIYFWRKGVREFSQT